MLNEFSTCNRLKEEIEQLTQVAKQQQEQIKKYAMYQKFMEKVLETSPEVSYNM